MFSKETEALLHKSLPVLPYIISNHSFKHDIDELVAMALPLKRLAVVDDANTAAAFGDQVFRALKGRFDCVHITLEGAVTADNETVEHVRQKSKMADALITVGGGTINDISKYASFQDGKPYVVFPSAASMNGYLSANASITFNGYKKTVAAQMPKALFCDMSVIAAAPPRLGKSGLGDSLARSTAQADWLLSHMVLGTDYNETPFELLKLLELQLHANARGIEMGDVASIELLMQILLLSGLGMTIAGGSYPASQGEHMIAHGMEMLGMASHFHGEEIGVTTLTMALMQEELLRMRPALHPLDFPMEKMTEFFGSTVAVEAKKAYRIKQEKMNFCFQERNIDWDVIAERIEPIMIPSSTIQSILKAAECFDTPEALGWDYKIYESTIGYAHFLRDRFTFLDINPDSFSSAPR